MKELSIEEKAKRYDEALERYKAKQEYESQKVHEFIEYLFPELKESEDERIRKEIKDFFSRIMLGQENLLKEDYDWNTWLAWIEKQGENANFFNKIQIGDKVTRNRDGVLVNLSQLNRVAKPAEKSLQEEPVSEDLKEAALMHFKDVMEYEIKTGHKMAHMTSFKAGAEWQKKHLWRDAQGDDLPDIDREVVALTQPYPDDEHLRVVFAHRPSKYTKVWNYDLGEEQVVEVERYGKGGWNIPNIMYWLDVKLPKEIEL